MIRLNCSHDMRQKAHMGWLWLVGSSKIIGHFCKRALQKRRYSAFAKETYNFEEPTNRSHPISTNDLYMRKKNSRQAKSSIYTCMYIHVYIYICTCIFDVAISPRLTHCNPLQPTARFGRQTLRICCVVLQCVLRCELQCATLDRQTLQISRVLTNPSDMSSKHVYRVAEVHRMPQVAGLFQHRSHQS